MNKKYRGKSNLSIIQNYLDGTRPFIQVGFVGDRNKYRKEGEKWIDKENIEWQRKGDKNVRLTKTQGDIIREMIQQKCACGQIINWGTRLDKLFFNKTGMCENCLIDYETKLRILNIYPDYERYKILSNQLSQLKEAKSKLKEIIKYFTENSGDMEMICNSEGFVERWKNTNKDDIITGAKNDLKIARRKITELSKIVIEAKAIFEKAVAPYKL